MHDTILSISLAFGLLVARQSSIAKFITLSSGVEAHDEYLIDSLYDNISNGSDPTSIP
jgi:hypothetical protein